MSTELKGIKVGSETASENLDGDREYEATYIVVASDGSVPLTEVREAAGLPEVNQRYLNDYTAICTSVDAQRRPKSQTICDVHCRWETKPLKDQKPDSDKPPWEQPPEPSWDEVPVDIVTPVDLEGHIFRDEAGTPIDPPPVVPQSNQVLTILRNEIGFSPQDARFYGNTINGDGWFGFPKYAVKLLMPTATGIWEDDQLYWQVVYRLEIMCGWAWVDEEQRQLLWEPYLTPHLGPMHIPDDGGDAVRNTDGFGDPIMIPQKLDQDGHLLPKDVPTHWLQWYLYRQTNFSEYFDWLGSERAYGTGRGRRRRP
ncbi:hypothetical protein LCGC14_2700630 [marine sediment metagenome]|uniref:Uncharacterized protein n=1 Tax=marine sediment metagenome TaxID=412755 RepID=A0A0F8ZFX4_9ZZZZ